MATTTPTSEPNPRVASPSRPPGPAGPAPASAGDFRESFGEGLEQVLDVNSWQSGRDLAQEYERIESEVREAVAREDEYQRHTRAVVFPKLFDPAAAPPGGGVYDANRDVLRLIQRSLLFNG